VKNIEIKCPKCDRKFLTLEAKNKHLERGECLRKGSSKEQQKAAEMMHGFTKRIMGKWRLGGKK